jgi:tryptophanyl-tRNA synthetase
MKDVIVSGIQPTGELHLGNYLGAVRQYLNLQNDKQKKCFFFIADYHSLTENYEPKEKPAQVLGLAKDLLALGLDPKKCTFFVQSHVPKVTELAWIFNTLTPISFLEKMTQYKDKAGRQAENINAGLFNYPVLMAADILLYHGTQVPVGEDQVQHLELARDVARFFNNRFGEYFKAPMPILTETPRVMSLTESVKKMSKSLGPRSYIALRDEPEVIAKKIAGVPTEATGKLPYKTKEEFLANVKDGEREQGFLSVYNLLELLKIFSTEPRAKYYIEHQPIKYGALKQEVAAAISTNFADFRKKRRALDSKDALVQRVLAAGAIKARTVAHKTIKEVKERIGLTF